MKKPRILLRLVIGAMCISGAFNGLSQEYNDQIGKLIEGNIQACVYIQIGQTFGSGILVVDERSIFLITAKHVIFKMDKGSPLEVKGEKGKIKFYTHDFVNEKERIIDFNLRAVLETGNIKAHPKMDVCVVKLADHKNLSIAYIDGVSRSYGRTTYNPYPINETKRLKGKKDLYLGDDLFTVGFPNTIGISSVPQFDMNRPLFKKCSVASLSDQFSTFVTDCSVYGGNSGGAVFLERRGPEVFAISLVGIIVERIPFYRNLIDDKGMAVKERIVDQTSNYSIVVPIEFAVELIDQFHTTQ